MKKRNTIILTIIALVSVALAALYGMSRKTSPEYPEINFVGGDIKVSVTATDEELLKGVTATDPEDGDVTDSLVVEGLTNLIKGKKINVTYAAIDSENHVTKASRTVKFVDYESPHFTLSAPLIFKLSNNMDLLGIAGAEDIFDGDISSNLKYSMSDDISFDTIGEYKVKLIVTNRLGDTEKLPVTVEITDEEPNCEAITLTDYLVYIDEGDEFNAEDYVESYYVGSEKHSSAKGLKITDDVDTEEPGVYTVDYEYTGKTPCRTRLVVVVK